MQKHRVTPQVINPLREIEQTHFTKSHTYFKTQKAKQK